MKIAEKFPNVRKQELEYFLKRFGLLINKEDVSDNQHMYSHSVYLNLKVKQMNSKIKYYAKKHFTRWKLITYYSDYVTLIHMTGQRPENWRKNYEDLRYFS